MIMRLAQTRPLSFPTSAWQGGELRERKGGEVIGGKLLLTPLRHRCSSFLQREWNPPSFPQDFPDCQGGHLCCTDDAAHHVIKALPSRKAAQEL